MRLPRSVLAIVPPTGLYVREDRCQTPLDRFCTVAPRPPIDLMYAAAVFERAGARCRVLDCPVEGLGWPHLERALRAVRPDVLIISCTTQTLARDLEAAALAKRLLPSVLTIAKGAHFNTMDIDAMSRYGALDVALREELEEPCRELASGAVPSDIAGITYRRADGRVVRNRSRGFPRDLDAIPFPARHLVRNELYARPDTGRPQTTLVTNRGCPHECIYCLAGQVAGKANRYRSVDNVIAEIRECVDRHGIRDFLFRSDLFTQNPAWVRELCDAIVAARLDIEWACNSRVDSVDSGVLVAMKRAGCWIIAFGVESGDQAALDRMRKRARVADAFDAVRSCRRAGIKSSAYLLLGLPWDDAASLEAQIEFGRRLDPDILEFFYPYPFPGTELRRTCVELGLLGKDEIPVQSYSEPAFPTLHLTKDQLEEYRAKGLRRFYVRPIKVARTLSQARSVDELANYLRAGLSQLRLLAS